MNIKSVGAAGLAFALSIAASGQALASIYDPAADFEAGWTTSNNPNGVWSYGYSSTVSGPVILYNAQVPGADSPSQQQQWISTAVNCCVASPSVGFNNGPAFFNGNVGMTAHQISLIAGVFGLSTDLVFTAPQSGLYTFSGDFTGNQVGVGVNVEVLQNSNLLFNSSVTSYGQIVPFSDSLALSAGDTLRFEVTTGRGFQNAGLDLTISAVPEPSAWAMMILGFAGVGFMAYRRKTAALAV
jgi:hypothetical protein